MKKNPIALWSIASLFAGILLLFAASLDTLTAQADDPGAGEVIPAAMQPGDGEVGPELLPPDLPNILNTLDDGDEVSVASSRTH